ARSPARGAAARVVQPPLPVGHGRNREPRAPEAGKARDRADPDGCERTRGRKGKGDVLSENEKNDEQIEETPAEPESVEATAAEEAAAAPQPAPKKKPKRRPRRLRPQKRRRRVAPGGERKPIVREPKPEHDRGRRQERRGIVVSSAMDKTIVVKVDLITSHQR